MSFPYMNPTVIVITPDDPDGNLADVPVFQAPSSFSITDCEVFSRSAVTGADADYVDCKLHKLGNTTHTYAALNVKAGVNITANSWQALTLNTTSQPVTAGDTVALTVTFADAANLNFGATAGTVIWQIRGVQGRNADTGED